MVRASFAPLVPLASRTRLVGQASTADHEAFAATGPQSDLVGPAAAWIRPGPKGPSSELIAAVVETKRRNPRMGCRKIAEQISSATGSSVSEYCIQ